MQQTHPSLPILLVLVGLHASAWAQSGAGQGAAQTAATPKVEARSADPAWIVAQSAAAIQSRNAVSANLRYRADLRGAHMLGTGAYW